MALCRNIRRRVIGSGGYGGNAVLAIGLLSGESQGDGITENVANLRLPLKQSEHVGRGPKKQ